MPFNNPNSPAKVCSVCGIILDYGGGESLNEILVICDDCKSYQYWQDLIRRASLLPESYQKKLGISSKNN